MVKGESVHCCDDGHIRRCKGNMDTGVTVDTSGGERGK